MTKVLLTEAEVREHYQLSHWMLWNLRREGRLRAVKIGKSVRFDRADLDAFVDAHREVGPDAA